MQSRDGKSELEALELELVQKEILLETFLKSGEADQKTKLILHDIKTLRDRIEKLKSKNYL